MAYTVINFKSKKALKEAVEAHNAWASGNRTAFGGFKPNEVRCYQPGLGPDLSDYTGTVYLEGPHYPKPHTWYAQAELKNGIVVKVK